jgi:hypothetical protein
MVRIRVCLFEGSRASWMKSASQCSVSASRVWSRARVTFAPTFVGTNGGLDFAILSQPVRFTYTGQSLVRVTATRLVSYDGPGFVNIGLSGHFVKP